MIRLKNVDKSFGKQRVIENFSIEIKDGEKVAFMGRSGAGKTTLLNMILGLIKPDGGEVFSDIENVGAVFQEDRLIERLSALGNCRAVMKDTGREEEILLKLGLSGGLERKPVSELSGGERRRASIARALCCGPELLILDEPFKGIDGETLPKVTELINELAKESTVILVTHSEDEAKALGARIVEIAVRNEKA